MSSLNRTEEPLPQILNELVNDRGCFARIVGRLHPDTDPYTILVHAQVLDEVSRNHERSKGLQSGWLYGCLENSGHIIEISGSSLAQDTREGVIPANVTELGQQLGMWIIQEEQDAQMPYPEESLPVDVRLLLKVPWRLSRLFKPHTPYGVYIREKEGSAFTGPMGFIVIEKKRTANSMESSHYSPQEPFDPRQESDEKMNHWAEKPRAAIPSKIKVKRFDSATPDGRLDSMPMDQSGETSELKKIKIDKDIITRYEGLSFLNKRHYSTPRDYTDTVPDLEDQVPKCSQSLFIEKITLINIISSSNNLMRDDIYCYTLLEGRQANTADRRQVFYVNAAYNRSFSPDELEHPEKHYNRATQANTDPRSKFKLRLWCIYAKHQLLYTLDHLVVFRYLLRFLESSCTQVGLVITTGHGALPQHHFFDSGAFRMSAFINAAKSTSPEYFSENQFHIIDPIGR